MRWSKLRKELLDRLAESLKGRLDYHLTTYKNSTGYVGRAWITWDGKEILNFSNQDTWNEFRSYSNKLAGTYRIAHSIDNTTSDMRGTDILLKGEFSKYDFSVNAHSYLSMNVHSALKSGNPILMALAIVDKRIGNRTIVKLINTEVHPLIAYLIELRMTNSREKF